MGRAQRKPRGLFYKARGAFPRFLMLLAVEHEVSCAPQADDEEGWQGDEWYKNDWHRSPSFQKLQSLMFV